MSTPSRFVLTIACSLATHICAQEEPAKDPDLLRFENGDVLHGRFEGMENGTSVTWSGNSIKSSINLQSGTLRRIALNGGRAAKSLPQPEFVQLVNGDQIPGRFEVYLGRLWDQDSELGFCQQEFKPEPWPRPAALSGFYASVALASCAEVRILAFGPRFYFGFKTRMRSS